MTTPQNIYDDPVFFAGYLKLRDTESGLNAAIEQPAFDALLPPLAGRRVLDLGSGLGDFARRARAQGAAEVVGVELSRRMLAVARERTDDAQVRYVHSSIESFDCGEREWDLVAASLALHYVDDVASLARRVHRGLRPGGRFVFSVEHPVCTACPQDWVKDAEGNLLHWPLDDYANEGQREIEWWVPGVRKFHRTVSTYVNALLEAGFALRRMAEPGPVPAALAARPGLAVHARRPVFLLLSAEWA
jgi:SAM-dependent methyltransferase